MKHNAFSTKILSTENKGKIQKSGVCGSKKGIFDLRAYLEIIYFCGMIRRGFLTLCAILATLAVFAQGDNTTASRGSRTVDTLDGLVLRTMTFDGSQVFGSNQAVFILEVQRTSGYSLRFAHEERRTPTSAMALKNGAAAAVNGSFFDMEQHFPICHLRIDGVDKGENTPGKDTVNRKYYQYGAICIEGDSVFIVKTDSSRRWEETLPFSNVMTAGPLLIKDHVRQPLRGDRTFVTKRHNRTALGILDSGDVLLVVADGRFRQAEGLTLFELQEFMETLGCRDAINLDGGGSTTLFLNAGGRRGVANHPSDNGRFDHYGERPVSNAIMVVKKQP